MQAKDFLKLLALIASAGYVIFFILTALPIYLLLWGGGAIPFALFLGALLVAVVISISWIKD